MSYASSFSPTLNVEVATLYTRTVNITSPPDGYTFPAGNSVTITWTYDGPAELGNIAVNLIHIPELDWTTGGSAVIPGGYFSEAGTYEILVVGNWGTFDKITITAYAVVVNTTLTISAPSSVDPGASLTFTGNLSAPELGAGIGGVPITLEQPPGTPIATGTTDGNGNYSITVNAPTAQGTYSYRTSFAEITGLAAAQSPTMGIGVGVTAEGIGIAALAAIAAVVWTIFKK